jgi:CHAT domain-containing protein
LWHPVGSEGTMPGTYLDFDLLIEHAAQGYRAKVLDSPTGQAAADFSLPFSSQDMEIFLLRLTRSLSEARRRVRRLESQERELVKGFGGQLFQAMFSGAVLTALQSSLNEAFRKDAGLRIRLRLTDTPELADVPWEFLFNPAANRFLNLAPDTPLIRYLDLPMPVRPLTVTPPLRVLVMISSPTDFPQLDVGAELDRLNTALDEVLKRGLVTITRLPSASLAGLQRPLRLDSYHIFHFIGHGGFDEHAQDGALALADSQGRARLVSGQDLGVMLSAHRSLRLIVLNACEGARASSSDPFAGVAQSLVQLGIPAVIAMQFEISDEAAITFAEELYAAIADGYSVDAALGEARRAIFASGNDVEWATPVLYTRSANGQLFRLTKQREAARLAQEQAQREEAARLTQEQAQREEAARDSAAAERAERVQGEPANASPGDREFGKASVEAASTPDAPVTPVPAATPGWLRRHARLAIAAVLIAIIAGGVVIAMKVGGREGSDPQYQALLNRLPASIQPSCYNGRNVSGQNWMIEDNRALAQGTCKEEPYYLTFGLWSTASGAQTYAANAQTFAANAGSDRVQCAPNTINAMKTILPRATRACWDEMGGDNPGIFMVWNEDGSPVAAHYWSGTHDQGEALSHWKTVAQAP